LEREVGVMMQSLIEWLREEHDRLSIRYDKTDSVREQESLHGSMLTVKKLINLVEGKKIKKVM
jgi:hypothetical protein